MIRTASGPSAAKRRRDAARESTRRSAQIIDKIGPYIEMEAFTPAQVQKASKACTAMCMWVRAMHKYHQVSVMVEPKKKLLAEATAELEETMQKLAEAQARPRRPIHFHASRLRE